MSVAKSLASSIARSVASSVTIADGGGTSPSAPVITLQPVDQDYDTAVTFEVNATGNPTPTYQWQELI